MHLREYSDHLEAYLETQHISKSESRQDTDAQKSDK
jgi:hypothetical protein